MSKCVLGMILLGVLMSACQSFEGDIESLGCGEEYRRGTMHEAGRHVRIQYPYFERIDDVVDVAAERAKITAAKEWAAREPDRCLRAGYENWIWYSEYELNGMIQRYGEDRRVHEIQEKLERARR